MPNVKIYVEAALDQARGRDLTAALPGLRALLCESLQVGPAACQIALMAVRGLDDQPPVNAELMILPTPARTRALLTEVAEAVRAHLATAAGAHVAVRIAQLDAETYLALK